MGSATGSNGCAPSPRPRSASRFRSRIQIRRISATGAAMALGALSVAVGALLVDVGDPVDVVDTMQRADWGWLALAIVVAFAANVAYAVALKGPCAPDCRSVPRRSSQVAMSFSNLAVPAIGGQGMQVRFLQRLGVDCLGGRCGRGAQWLRRARRGVRLLRGGAGGRAGSRRPVADPDRWPAPAPRRAGSAAGPRQRVARRPSPCARARVLPPCPAPPHDDGLAPFRPGVFVLLVGGNVVATVMSTWCLQLCLIVFGRARLVLGAPGRQRRSGDDRVHRAGARRRNRGGHGGPLGSAGLVRGRARDVAVASVLANQLVYYYLPAVPGWFATRSLLRRDYL